MAQTTAYPIHPAWKTSTPGPMLAHQRMPWKPTPLPHNPDLELGQAGAVKAATLGALLLPTAVAAAVAYVGFRLGSKDEGFESILGYIVGALGGISAVMGLLAMLGVAVTPFNFPPTVQPPVSQPVSAGPAA